MCGEIVGSQVFFVAGTQDMEACMRVSKAVEHVLGVNEDPRTQAQHLQVCSMFLTSTFWLSVACFCYEATVQRDSACSCAGVSAFYLGCATQDPSPLQSATVAMLCLHRTICMCWFVCTSVRQRRLMHLCKQLLVSWKAWKGQVLLFVLWLQQGIQ